MPKKQKRGSGSSEVERVAEDGFVSWKEQVQNMSEEEFEAFLRAKADEITNKVADGVIEELADKVGEEDDGQQEKEGLEEGELSSGDKEVEMGDRVKEAAEVF
jgi:hypothetical protein